MLAAHRSIGWFGRVEMIAMDRPTIRESAQNTWWNTLLSWGCNACRRQKKSAGQASIGLTTKRCGEEENNQTAHGEDKKR
jgi:tRNA(Ile2) C34 agmatinyltransferase TiaS